jgi:hypothetical protein
MRIYLDNLMKFFAGLFAQDSFGKRLHNQGISTYFAEVPEPVLIGAELRDSNHRGSRPSYRDWP